MNGISSIGQENIGDLKPQIELEDHILGEDLTFKFTYKGVKAEIKRIPELLHLCGYIHLTESINMEQYRFLEKHSHGGITYDSDNVIGFDCAHGGDIIPRNYFDFGHISYGHYRDFNYVMNTLENMIDAMQVN